GVNVAGAADELHVATHAREILTELGQNSAGRILVVVERIVRERVTDQRGQNRPARELALDRQRRLPANVAVRNAGISHRRRERRGRAHLVCGREGIHEIRIDVVAVHQVGRQSDPLLIERIAQLQTDVFTQLKAQSRPEADRLGLVRHIARGVLLLVEQVEPGRHAIAEKIRIDERKLGAARILAVLYRDLSEQTAPAQIALGAADLPDESVRGGVAARDREFTRRLLLHIDIENDAIRRRARLGRYLDALEVGEILQSSLGAIDERTIVGIALGEVEFTPNHIVARAGVAANVDPFDVGALPLVDREGQ